MDIIRIKGVIKDYPWGNKDFIPSLIGGYNGKSQAELWFGTHPLGESVTENGEKLSDLIKRDKTVLGDAAYQKYGGTLPLLLKVLAIEKPLSLQCHPDKAQAEKGWAKEKAIRDAGGECNYKDDNQKAEVIAALSPITALFGFRKIDEIRSDLSRMLPSSYGKLIHPIAEDPGTLFAGLYRLSGTEKAEIIDELKAYLASSGNERWNGNFLTREGIAAEAVEEYPEDIGVIFPYIMNVVNLQIGEALFIKPGTLHAYVYGNGVELMNASDNVLRGGLTRKKVDLEELMSIMDASSSEPVKARIVKTGSGRTSYEIPSEDFLLRYAGDGQYSVKGGHLAIALATEGASRFSYKGESLIIEKGEAALIPASVAPFGLNVRGKLFFAELPDVPLSC